MQVSRILSSTMEKLRSAA